ncbi:UNVERIFIED_ORG: uncharacterized protein YndB with AHSA1/START domain [Ensifer adhaerens]|jgi:uncharacterized protein YndB with AHSA1/START domain|nr:uncharacterized protein YndB with AHSA1/START domain [Ensifer adhaerens]
MHGPIPPASSNGGFRRRPDARWSIWTCGRACAFVTRISEGGGAFTPHLDACFLAVDDIQRIVFTNSLVAGWRPAENPFMTAIITLKDHPEGTDYAAHVMHKSNADRNMHEEMGFHDGWGTVIAQLARLVEGRTQ